MQPLDKSVYGPFKKYINTACDSWLASNPGKTLTIYDMLKVVSNALPLAASPLNIIKGFNATGIYPLNENIFQGSNFMSSYVTDRLDPNEANLHSDETHKNCNSPETMENVDDPVVPTRPSTPDNQPSTSTGGPTAVSYTHLDVYKRQSIHTQRLRVPLSLMLVLALHRLHLVHFTRLITQYKVRVCSLFL